MKISLILPVFNEVENLKLLIPMIENTLSSLVDDYEVIIVDDNSNDGTDNLIKNIYSNRLVLIERNGANSLPLSILDGIKASKYEHILWMDADGSMPVEELSNLISKKEQNPDSVIIGSRFVEGGGYKGQDVNRKLNFFEMFFKIFNSEDSFVAIYLSIIFNKILKLLINSDINDLTSGFFLGEKKYINYNIFTKAIYGDYFIYLMTDLIIKNIKVIEVGYFCKPRLKGKSKTSTNIIKLFSLSYPYIKAGILSRRNINGKKYI